MDRGLGYVVRQGPEFGNGGFVVVLVLGFVCLRTSVSWCSHAGPWTQITIVIVYTLVLK